MKQCPFRFRLITNLTMVTFVRQHSNNFIIVYGNYGFGLYVSRMHTAKDVPNDIFEGQRISAF